MFITFITHSRENADSRSTNLTCRTQLYSKATRLVHVNKCGLHPKLQRCRQKSKLECHLFKLSSCLPQGVIQQSPDSVVSPTMNVDD